MFLNKEPIEFPAPARLALENPFTSSEANSLDYAFLPRSLGLLTDKLTTTYPILSKHVGFRLLEYSVFLAGDINWMVFSHEQGHYRISHQLGLSPSIEFFNFASAGTNIHITKELVNSYDNLQHLNTAGVNQGQLNALLIYQDWSRNTQARYPEALAYLLAKTNLMFYGVRSTLRAGADPSKDDLTSFVFFATATEVPVNYHHIVISSVMTTVLSGNVWASLIGQAQFLIKGKRWIQAPYLTIKDWQLFAPEFSAFLVPQGFIVGGEWLVRTPNHLSLGVESHVRLDGAGSFGFKMYDLSVTPWLHFHPYLRTSIFSDHSLGVAGGTEAMLNVVGPISIVGKIEYQNRDLLSDVTGKTNGFQGLVSIGFH